MNRIRASLCCGFLAVALIAAAMYGPVIAADPAVPAADPATTVSQDAALDTVREDFDALISEIEARQPEADITAGGGDSSGGTAEQLHAANIQIGILQQAVVAALAARAEAEAQLETQWRDSRAEIEALKAAQAEDAARISDLESAVAEAKGGAVAASAKEDEEGEVQAAAFAPADDAAANGAADSGEAGGDLASIAPGSGPIEIMLGEIHFNPGSADLTPGGKRKTMAAADRIKQLPVSKIRIAGYTDTLGASAYNKHLSLQRAASIAEMLSSIGVPAEIITLEGNGEDGAPEPTADQVSEPLNRCAGIFALAEFPADQPAQ